MGMCGHGKAIDEWLHLVGRNVARGCDPLVCGAQVGCSPGIVDGDHRDVNRSAVLVD